MVGDELDVAPEYMFDVDANESFWQNRPTASTMPPDNNDDHDLPFFDHTVAQDLNNNNDNENHETGNNIQKGEYSYHAFKNIKNYWAGPSYWKHVPRNRPTIQSNRETIEVKSRGRRGKKKHDKPLFIDNDGNVSSSGDEMFIKATSRAAKKIRLCNYKRWAPEKLKLPLTNDIPRDLFHAYAFEPSHDIFNTRRSVESDSNIPENDVEDDFPVSIFTITS